MAWNGNNNNWKWQLRDRKGRWIEMGRGVKWYSPRLGREVSGTVIDQKGKEAVVSLTSEPNDPKTGKPQQVNVKGSDIEVIENKATLGGPAPTPEAPKADVPETDEEVDTSPAAKAPSVAAPSRTADIEKDLGFLEQDAEDVAELEDGEERTAAIEAAEYPFTNDAGEEVTMRLADVDGEGTEIELVDAKGTELGRFGVPESGGERMETAKAIRDTSNGTKPKPKAVIEEEPADEPVEAPEAPEAPETPEETPEAPEEAPEPVEAPFSRHIQEPKVRKALADEIAAKGDNAGISVDGSQLEVTDPVKAIETARKLSVNANSDYDGAKGKVARTNLFGAKRELEAVTRMLNERYPEEAKVARNGYVVADEDEKANLGTPSGAPTPTPAPQEAEAPKAPEKTPEPTPAPKAPVADALEAAGVTRTEPITLEGEKFPPTRQQQDVIDAVLAGKNTAVQAKAGTGKTSTLEALAKRVALQDPDKKIAYIAFNKTVQTEAEGRMPGNVEARTGHSIAYAWAKPWMKTRSNDNNALRRPDDIAAALGIRTTVRTDDGEPLSAKEQAMAAVRTVDTYANSGEDNIQTSHMPDNVRGLGTDAEKAVLDAANKIWADLQKEKGAMRFSLDHMRKMWALSKPDFTKPGSGLKRPAQLIFMDESQDTPPVLAKVMDEQTAQKVVVGDSDQNIYSSFTGSIDYMAQTQKDVELPLTKSWRFGPAVADVGNRFLELVGSKGRVEGGGQSEIVQNMQDPDAILVRSNAGMIGEAIAEIEKGRTVGVPKNTKQDLNSLVNSAAFLKGMGDAPGKMHDDLAQYRTWDEVLADAEKGNATAKKVSGLVNQHGIGGLRAVVNAMVENGGDGLVGVTYNDQPHGRMAEGKTFGASQYLKQAGFKWTAIPGGGVYVSGKNKGQPRKAWTALGTPDERDAMARRAVELSGGEAVDVTIATAHKSKGLEWNNVKIGDDFRGPSVNEETGETDMPSPEELRLAYVAVTRAQKKLDVGSLGYVFDFTQENGGIPDTDTPDTSGETDNDPVEDRGVPTPTGPDTEDSDDTTGDPMPEEEPAPVEEDAPDERPEDDANREEVDRANKENEEAPAPEDDGPVAEETPVPEEEQSPEPEPDDLVDNPEEVPEPAPLPQKETPAPAPEPEEEVAPTPEPAPEPAPAPQETPAPAPQTPTEEEAPAPAPEEAPRDGTAPPEPEDKPLHPVKVKAANYPDGSVLRSARTGEAIQKAGGSWHVAGKPNEAADPMDMDSPFVYDMPKQDNGSFDTFEGLDTVGPGDIIVTRKGTQAAVVGKRDGKLVVAAHNQTEEQRRLRPALVAIDPATVKGVNKFDAVAEEVTDTQTPAPERKRTPFSGNRGNSNVTIKDVSGNEVKIGDTVRTDKGTGTIVRVRPSDGPSGSAFVQFDDGTIKSFRSNKLRNTAFAEETASGDDPSKMEIGSMGEAGDGRAFMVGKGNKPIFKGDNVALADGTTGKVSGFAKGVSSVNIRVEGRATDIRKKASVVDAIDYNAPETTTSADDTTPEAPEEDGTGGTPTPDEPTNGPAGGAGFANEEFAQKYRDAMDAAGITTEELKNSFDKIEAKYFHADGAKDAVDKLATGNVKNLRQYIDQLSTISSVRIFIKFAMDDGGKPVPPEVTALLDKFDASFNIMKLNEEYNASIPKMVTGRKITAMSDQEIAAYDGMQGARDFDLATSKFNPLSPKGLAVGEDNLTNGFVRAGVKVADKDGNFIGTVLHEFAGSVGVRLAKWSQKDSPDTDSQLFKVEDLQPFTGTWDTSTDLKFKDTDRASTVNRIMSKTYPGVLFDFTAYDDRMAREYAESASRLFNKYPVLQTTMISMNASEFQGDRMKGATAVMQANRNWSDTQHNTARMSINKNTYSDLRRSTYAGSKSNWFNNVRPGNEVDYIVSHEMGHVADFMTGRIKSANDIGELLNVVWGPAQETTRNLEGRVSRDTRMWSAGALSKYSLENGKIYIVELVAESFADVEHNGIKAKPLSKMIHKEIVERMNEN